MPDAGEPELMPHGYTHRTSRRGAAVTKAYQGPEAAARCTREAAALTALAGFLPVPPVLEIGPGHLVTRLMPGIHGQDLIAAGLAGQVLAACGRMLRQIHQLPVPGALTAVGEQGAFLVHGDFGPNNVLLDDRALAVTAVVDWEWAHAGDPVEDLAWCEFIVRLHHPAESAALDGFYAAYGSRPPWAELQREILGRCQEMLELCERWQAGGESARAWAARIAIARSWAERPDD
jgi:aminoglycoside phosphotransferase (APT) family kinase protein